eukprot:44949-Prymnesium_polylepis.1
MDDKINAKIADKSISTVIGLLRRIVMSAFLPPYMPPRLAALVKEFVERVWSVIEADLEDKIF